ncbi:glycoside hydrolase family 130 protein [Novosphingobium sp. Leaf2]|uniref:glycoside hydrolase family 130 protein n=1 Tax=Novosphingobium sp. Leaf2 TaxID=1735670 RepID=UPI0006F819B4|nr:glycoside hydrolase family 130 protein [Novosphingobium sp. Leaf2]KQM17372.1 glycosidase [Novosphingobium sp. Leaf2]
MEAKDVFTKLDLELRPDPARTVIRPFNFEYPEPYAKERPPRPRVVLERLMATDDETRNRMMAVVAGPMRERHRNADATFLRQISAVSTDICDVSQLNERDRVLLGAYFSQEYAFESAALFNPSIVLMPAEDSSDQDPELKVRQDEGDVRFLLSLRGIGEGHVSSVTFRTGTWDGKEAVSIDPVSCYSVPPRIESDNEGWVRLRCDDSEDASETVIFPVLPSQHQGVEDLRMVIFTEDDGRQFLIGTYTAFDGKSARQELLRGVNRQTFEMRALEGAMTATKGMALFPRRIDGKYVMLGRQDNENIWLLRSDDLFTWEEGEPILGPRYPWEFVQMGNCGSPTEIDEGWLVFTHGVGLVRGYCIGACLLDKADPSKVLARTASPLIFPSAEQRGGYVPNVTYTCGVLVQGRRILLPYAIGDEITGFSVGNVDDLLSAMVPA